MRKVYLLILMLCVSGLIYAQEETTNSSTNIVIGAKLGGNLTYLWGRGTDYVSVKPFPGIHVGGYIRYSLTEKLSIQPELLFSTRGISVQKYVGNSDDGFYVNDPIFTTAGYEVDRPYSSKTKLNIFYIDLPVMVQYGVIPNLRIHAGPVISLNVWDQYPRTRTSDNVRIKSDKSYSKIEPFEFGIALGGAYNFELMGHKLTAGARYTLGLTRINQPVRANDDLRSSMFQIFLAYDIKALSL